MKTALTAIGWVAGVFVVTSLVAALDGRAAMALAVSAAGVAAYGFFRPVAVLGLDSMAVRLSIVAAAALTLAASSGVFRQQEKQQLLSLRGRDPIAYLASVKGRLNDTAYLDELRALDPKGHAAEMQRRDAERMALEEARQIAAEKEKAEVIAGLAAKLTLPDELALRKRLAALDPQLASNNTRLARIEQELRAIEEKAAEEKRRLETEARARSNPEEFLDLVDFAWRKGGFGVVMEATFKVRNRSPFDIKDIAFICDHSAQSGTKIDSNRQVVFQLVKKGATKTFSKINMGFIHTQAASSSCRIVGAKSV